MRHIDAEFAKGGRETPSYVSVSQENAAKVEARGGEGHINPAQDKISVQRKRVQHDFGTVARALAAGDQVDQRLAVEIVQFVQQMPPVKTRHAELVEVLRREVARQGEQGIDRGQQPTNDRESGR